MVKWSDLLHLHFIILLWGLTAILGVLITLPAVEIVFYRCVLAFIGIGVVLKVQGMPFVVERNESIKLMFNGVLIAIHWILFFLAVEVSNVSICLIGLSTGALWTSLLAPLMLKSPFKKLDLAFGLLVVIGIAIIAQSEFEYVLGLTLAIASAFLQAVFTINNSVFAKKHYKFTVTFYGMGSAALSVLIFFPFYHFYLAPDGLQLAWRGLDFLWFAILILLCTVYAWTASVGLMKRITPFLFNLSVNMEPVYAIALALLLFGESELMGPLFYLGAGIILLTVFLYPIISDSTSTPDKPTV